ncbi:DUF6794 domain-containing protein [Neisseria sp. Ec49-e6-T10]|uniref:DUF6794 domain-containing protein n=1 Tax=Neisseria sp. Ec49-e6-T10 TaxID=3140744 RepID=UPI003EBF1C67
MNKYFTTIESVIEDLQHKLSTEDKYLIQSTAESELVRFHFGLGTMIRNEYRLWTEKQKLLNECAVMHPDDTSSIIIKKLWSTLRQETKTQ